MKYQTNKYKVHVVVVEVPGDGDNFGVQVKKEINRVLGEIKN